MKKEINLRTEQAKATKGKITEMSLQLLKDHTVNEVSVNLICNNCGISKGAFYHHFESKDDLMVYHFTKLMNEDLSGQFCQKELEVREKFEIYLKVIIDISLKLGKEWTNYYFKVRLTNPKYSDMYFEGNEFTQICKEAMEKKVFSNEHSYKFYEEYLSSIIDYGMFRWCLPTGDDHDIENMKIYFWTAFESIRNK